MNRKDQLEFCKKCENKSFDSKKGIICSLTNEQADFEKDCPNFKEKKSIEKHREYIKKLDSDKIIRYPILKKIIEILNVFGWIVGITTIITTIISIYGLFGLQSIDIAVFIPIIAFLIQGLFVAFILIAISELIKVVLDIEKNTRNY